MEYSLDTSICVEILRRGEQFKAIDLNLADCMLSSIVRFELEYGIQKAPSKLKVKLKERLDLLLDNVPCLEFDNEAAIHAASIRTSLEKKGTPIGHFDTLIAGHARSQQLAIVTGNSREFKRVPKLKVISI